MRAGLLPWESQAAIISSCIRKHNTKPSSLNYSCGLTWTVMAVFYELWLAMIFKSKHLDNLLLYIYWFTHLQTTLENPVILNKFIFLVAIIFCLIIHSISSKCRLIRLLWSSKLLYWSAYQELQICAERIVLDFESFKWEDT